MDEVGLVSVLAALFSLLGDFDAAPALAIAEASFSEVFTGVLTS